MTAEDRQKYGQTRTMCEFMTNVVSAMEFSGGMTQEVSDRMEEIVAPVRMARDLMWHAGELMVQSRPLPNGFHEALEIAEDRALDALPGFKALLDQVCDDLVLAAHKSGFGKDATERPIGSRGRTDAPARLS